MTNSQHFSHFTPNERNKKILYCLLGNHIPSTTKAPLRIAIASWLLCMVVVVNAYAGLLTAMMTVPKLEPIVNTLDELATSHRFKITKEVHSVLTTQFLVIYRFTYVTTAFSIFSPKPKCLIFEIL